MWRLQNGEVRKGMRAGVVVLHIGSSDLTYASFQVSDHSRRIGCILAHIWAGSLPVRLFQSCHASRDSKHCLWSGQR